MPPTVRLGQRADGEYVLPITQDVASRLGITIGDHLAFRLVDDGATVRRVTLEAPLQPDEYPGTVVPAEEESGE